MNSKTYNAARKQFEAARAYLDGSDEPIGTVKEFSFDANGISGEFELFTKKKEEKISPERLRELLASQSTTQNTQGGSLVPEWLKDNLTGSFVNNTTSFGPWTQTYEWPNLMGLRKGEKKVAGATFQTLTLTHDGVETEVVWFEGEGLPDVLERLAQAMR